MRVVTVQAARAIIAGVAQRYHWCVPKSKSVLLRASEGFGAEPCATDPITADAAISNEVYQRSAGETSALG